MEGETFTINENGKELTCTILTNIYSESRDKYYVVYEVEDDDDNIYVSSYDPLDETGSLEDVTDEAELEELKKTLEEME